MACVLLDCDGVLVDFYSVWLKAIPGCDLTIHDLGSPNHPILHTAAAHKAQFELLEEHTQIHPLPGVPEVLEHLRSKHDVVCVTAAKTYARFRWLKQTLGFTTDTIIQTSAKRRIPADIFVDDLLSYTTSWYSRWQGRALLFSQPYNQSDELPSGIERISSLWEI